MLKGLTETTTSLSITCNEKGDSVIIVDVTIIVDHNDDDGKLCTAGVVSVVVGGITVTVVDENDVGKFFPFVIIFAKYARERIFLCSLLSWSTCSLLLTKDQTVFLLSRKLYIALVSCFSFAAAACIF